MPDSLTPVTREEDYLAAIAGQDVSPPDPVTRKEDWLDLIADNVADIAEDVEDLQAIAPTPAAADSGKVLTAGADGTGSWQTPSSGSNHVEFVLTEVEMGVYSVSSASATFAEICAMFAAGKPPLATIKNGDVFVYSNNAFSDGSLTVSFSFASISVDSGRGNVTFFSYYLENFGEGWTVSADSATLSV